MKVNIIEYLESNGFELKKKGKEYSLKEHDSLVINQEKNTWFWHSKGIGGSIIQFVQEFENKTLKETVSALNNNSYSINTFYTKPKPKKETEKVEIELPPQNENNKRVQAYLCNSRGIDYEIVNSAIKSGIIYESSDKHEVVFLGKDEFGEVKYANKRATLTGNKFRQDISNSSKKFGFRINGKSDKLFVFESPIDLLSHATISKMQGRDWQQDNRLSLGGVSDVGLKQYLNDNKNIKEIYLILDNDRAGIDSSNEILKKFSNKYNVKAFLTKEKDLNETLKKYKEDREIDKSKNIKDYFKLCKMPFIEPKLKEDGAEILKSYLKDIFKDDYKKVIENFVNSGTLALTEDDKAILFIKDESGKNIGGYKIDILGGKYENIEIIENSEIKPIFIEIPNSEEKTKALIITDNIATAFTYNEFFDVCIVQNEKDLENVFLKEQERESIGYDPYIREKYKNLFDRFSDKIKFEELSFTKKEYFEMLFKENYKLFSKPKMGANEELYSYLLQNTDIPKNKLIRMFKENRIYQDVERNMVFLCKNSFNNDIGGYKLNIYDDKKEIVKLENSDELESQKGKAEEFANYIKEALEIELSNEIEMEMEA